MSARLCFNYLFLLMLFVSLIHYSEENKELILASVVFRHGDRLPVGSFANDLFESTWTQNLGKLTKLGRQQSFHLGEILRSRYKGKLLNETYIVSEISAVSSIFRRSLMSTYCVLAAICYPTTDEEIWNPDIKWQPVPVMSIPFLEDNLLLAAASRCPAAYKLYNNYINSDEVQEIIHQNQEFFDFLSQPNITGELMELTDYKFIRAIDALMYEYSHGLTLPQWTKLHWKNENQTIYEKFTSFLQIAMKFEYCNPSLVRYIAGPLVKNIIDNMQKKINGDITQKLFLYCGSDTIMISLLTLLGVFNGLVPPDMSAILFELYRENGTYYFSLHYRNNTATDQILDLQLPMCQSPCLWSSFVENTNSLYPSDWESECNPKSFGANIAIGIIVAGCAILVITVLIVCLKRWYDNRRRSEYDTMNND